MMSSAPAARGRFITLEGGEGAGKSTQARLLADSIRTTGRTVVLTREPGGTPNAEVLRDLLLDRARGWSADAEILLHFAARAEHVAGVIAPALARGETVVCDRFFDSTLAYQGWGMGADRALISHLAARLPVRPALTFVLEVSPATRRARVAGRAGATDRYEAESEAFHARVAEGFASIAAAEPERCGVGDAGCGIDLVQQAIARHVAQRLSAAWPDD